MEKTALKILILVTLFSFSAFGKNWDSTTIEKVAQSDEWLRILHYYTPWIGQTRSQLDGSGYFFDPDGYYDPKKELIATLNALGSNKTVGVLKLKPHCGFPYRYKYLSKHFPLAMPTTPCPGLENFRKSFNDPQSLSLIFSAAYPNNPGSMFGHTFIKVNSKQGIPLFDKGLNFAALVPPGGEGGLDFIWKGLTGGYPGRWSSEPYYVKVKTYTNVESRDIWEYKLTATKQETLDFIDHVWELEVTTFFFYFFLDENCSYQILRALEAVRFDWTLANRAIGLVPGESVKDFTGEPGAVSEVSFRPSLYKQVLQQFKAMSKEEQGVILSTMSKESALENLRDPFLVDALITLTDYRRFENPKHKEKWDTFKKSALKHRSTLGVTKNKRLLPKHDERTRPDLGHDGHMFGMSTGSRELDGTNSMFSEFEIRSAYHDLIANDVGYKPFAQLEFPSAKIAYDWETESFQLQRLRLISTSSIQPFLAWDKRHSWKVNAELGPAIEYGCTYCNVAKLEAGMGIGFWFFGEKNIAYLLWQSQNFASRRLYRGFDSVTGPESGFIVQPAEFMKMQISATQLWSLIKGQPATTFSKGQVNFAFFLDRNLELRSLNTGSWSNNPELDHVLESRLSLLLYFR